MLPSSNTSDTSIAKRKRKRSKLGARLRAGGFDHSTYNRSTHSWRVRCSRCSALCINGVPCHEQGCPNQKRD